MEVSEAKVKYLKNIWRPGLNVIHGSRDFHLREGSGRYEWPTNFTQSSTGEMGWFDWVINS